MSKKEDEKAEQKAKKELRHGKSPKTAAGEFVEEEMRHYKQGKHGKSRRQAIAIGISKARRHGIPYPQRGQRRGRNDQQESGRSKKSLYQQAKKMGIAGRSKMNKKQLVQAIRKAS